MSQGHPRRAEVEQFALASHCSVGTGTQRIGRIRGSSHALHANPKFLIGVDGYRAVQQHSVEGIFRQFLGHDLAIYQRAGIIGGSVTATAPDFDGILAVGVRLALCGSAWHKTHRRDGMVVVAGQVGGLKPNCTRQVHRARGEADACAHCVGGPLDLRLGRIGRRLPLQPDIIPGRIVHYRIHRRWCRTSGLCRQ